MALAMPHVWFQPRSSRMCQCLFAKYVRGPVTCEKIIKPKGHHHQPSKHASLLSAYWQTIGYAQGLIRWLALPVALVARSGEASNMVGCLEFDIAPAAPWGRNPLSPVT